MGPLGMKNGGFFLLSLPRRSDEDGEGGLTGFINRTHVSCQEDNPLTKMTGSPGGSAFRQPGDLGNLPQTRISCVKRLRMRERWRVSKQRRAEV